MILGLAGKACSGKNAAARIFEKRGYRSLDVDKLGHLALEKKHDAVVDRFGKKILDSEGKIDRKALGVIVFSDKTRLKELEEITHPAIKGMVEHFIEENRRENCLINAAILGPSGMDRLCDRVLWVEAPLVKRIIRALNRDGNKISIIFSRILSQRHLTSQQFSAGVDIYMVRNRGSLEDLEKQVDLFLSGPENFKRV